MGVNYVCSNMRGMRPRIAHDPVHPLERRSDSGGDRYFLAGRPVYNGDEVEVALQEGGWLLLRLEGMPRELLGYGLPALAGGYELIVKVPRSANFRWPQKLKLPEAILEQGESGRDGAATRHAQSSLSFSPRAMRSSQAVPAKKTSS